MNEEFSRNEFEMLKARYREIISDERFCEQVVEFLSLQRTLRAFVDHFAQEENQS